LNPFESRLQLLTQLQANLLTMVNSSVLEATTARKRLEQRIRELEQHETQAAAEHEKAVSGGEEQSEALAEWPARTRERIAELQRDLADMVQIEAQLQERATQMHDQLSDFRVTIDLLSAKLVAARTAGVLGEVLDTLQNAVTYMEITVMGAAVADGLTPKSQRGKTGLAGEPVK
jgi:hypothetical protein